MGMFVSVCMVARRQVQGGALALPWILTSNYLL